MSGLLGYSLHDWFWSSATFTFGAVSPHHAWSRWVKREGIRFGRFSRYPIVNTTRECQRKS